MAIAGDLVQSGGEQRDWDEFWRHIAPLAASTFVLPALGNHDYFAGPNEFGRYATEDSERAVAKYRSYFSLPANGSAAADDSERYYAVRWGPVSLISLDLNNGRPNRGDRDTNWHLLGDGEGGKAPGWQPGSRQYRLAPIPPDRMRGRRASGPRATTCPTYRCAGLRRCSWNTASMCC
ncbi:MAG: metallophosphoesterase [Woeseiaceae bacterium]